MLIKISKVISTCGDESIVDIWINVSMIIKIEPVSYNNSIVKSLIYMKDVEPWDYIRCSMTPEEIVKNITGVVRMTGDFKWVKDREEADFLYGGEQFTITDEDIERLKNGEILNFFVNEEYGCTLNYDKEATND